MSFDLAGHLDNTYNFKLHIYHISNLLETSTEPEILEPKVFVTKYKIFQTIRYQVHKKRYNKFLIHIMLIIIDMVFCRPMILEF